MNKKTGKCLWQFWTRTLKTRPYCLKKKRKQSKKWTKRKKKAKKLERKQPKKWLSKLRIKLWKRTSSNSVSSKINWKPLVIKSFKLFKTSNEYTPTCKNSKRNLSNKNCKNWTATKRKMRTMIAKFKYRSRWTWCNKHIPKAYKWSRVRSSKNSTNWNSLCPILLR